ncbi:PPPDE putative peptidase domain containing protein [Novymonas esmeraldas]|uniref:PPPDE putative peptidase domain containing protein n=1 Tax=Novymonas esmeraldas TaxID=1808958 RepID=A0AAW0EM26_9TRYP
MAFCCCGVGGTAGVISKNAAQLRGLEALGMSRGHSPRLRRTEVQIPVTLNVYSLLESNKKLSKMGMGVFHTGVVVYGIEWGYGEVVDNPNASGLFCVHPGQAAGTLYRTIRIGYTTRSPMQVDTILHRLENEWRSCEYHILHHNCNHFAAAFCDLLSTTEKLQVPSWCNRAARVGDRVIPRRLATKVQHMMDDEPPKAMAPAPPSNISEIPMSVVPHEWYLHPSIFQPLRYTGDSRPPTVASGDGYGGGGGGGGGSMAAAAVAATGGGGGGGSHYSVEYDIVPPPGYEPADVAGAYPPLARREMHCSTDENGSITRMMAIEEQPCIVSSSRRESVRRSTASHRVAKPTLSNSPAPPSLGITFSSGGDDRVVLPRMRTSISHPHSVPLSGSPQASELDADVEHVLHSEMSEEMSPPLASHLPMVRSPQNSSIQQCADTPLSGGANRRRSSSSDHQQRQTCPLSPISFRAGGADVFPERHRRAVHSPSLPSSSMELSGQYASLAQLPLLSAAPHAMPVGCITTLSPTSLNSPAEAGAPRDGSAAPAPATPAAATPAAAAATPPATTPAAAAATTPAAATPAAAAATTPAATTPAAATPAVAATAGANVNTNAAQASDEVSNTASGDAAVAAQRGSKQPASATKQERSRKAKAAHEFSDIAAAAGDDASLSTATSAATTGKAVPTETKRRTSTAWNFLFKPHNGPSAPPRGSKSVRKYLSTPPPSDTASGASDASPRVEVASVSPASSTRPSRSSSTTSSLSQRPAERGSEREAVGFAAVVDSAADAPLGWRGEKDHTHVFLASAAEDKVTGLDAASAQETLDGHHASLVSAPAPAAAEERRSPGYNTTHLPMGCRLSTTEDAVDPLSDTVPQRLLQSETASAHGEAPSSTSLPDLGLSITADGAVVAVRAVDSAAMQLSPSVVTPERLNAVMTSGAVTTTGCSPAAAHRQCRRGSSSAAMSDSPPLQAQRSRTPVPLARRRHGNDENVAPVMRLDSGSDAIEPPVRRNSSRTAGDAGTPVAVERAAHTPMAPFPRRPSLLYREKAAAAASASAGGGGGSGGHVGHSNTTGDHSRTALVLQRSLNTELEEPAPLSLTPSESLPTFDDV